MAVPFAALGTAQLIRDEFLDVETAEKYKLPILLAGIRWEWYAIATLMLVVIILLESAYRSLRQRERKLATLLDEYIYSLQLMRVDQEDRRQLDAKNKSEKKVIRRQMRFMVRLKNSIAKPIRYEVTALEINGTSQPSVDTAGGVIVADGSTTYYSHWLDLPVSDLDNIYEAVMSIYMEYGPPDMMTRKVYKKMKLELLPGAQYMNMIYVKDIDEPKI